jgi:hypothetical protein
MDFPSGDSEQCSLWKLFLNPHAIFSNHWYARWLCTVFLLSLCFRCTSYMDLSQIPMTPECLTRVSETSAACRVP